MKKIILGMVFFCSMAFSADAPVIAVKQDVEKVFKLVSPHFDNKKKSFGTAFYISKTRLLTAAHTLKDSKEQWIEKDGQAIPCKIVRCDFKEDIAILETKQENKEFFKLVSKIKVIGFAKGEKYEESSGSIASRMIRARCRFVPGMSGGPLVNENGDVEGMGVENESEWDCYFIPASILSEFLKSTK